MSTTPTQTGGHPAVAGQFSPEGTYLDTASYGLASREALAASERALAQWRAGSARWPRDWDPAGEDCRALLAELVGADAADVALVPAVSVAVATVASVLAPGDVVLVAEDEFASLLWPLAAAARERGVVLRHVPFERLVDAVAPDVALVAASHVRSNDGRLLDLDALAAAARAVGAATLVDATHSAGVLPLDVTARGLDFVTAAAYKHLLCPRGVGFLTVAPRWRERVIPRCASWRAQADPAIGYYGGGLERLAPTAARFDVSLAWFAWIGALPSLRLLAAIPAAERAAWCVGLADALAAALGVQPTGSSVLSVPVRGDRAAVAAALADAGVAATAGETSVRLSLHLYNDERDVERGAAAVAPLLDRAALR